MLPRVVPAEGLLAANSLSQATRMVAGVIGGGITGVDRRGRRRQVWPVLIVDASTFLSRSRSILGVSPRPRACRARPQPRARRRSASAARSSRGCGSSPAPGALVAALAGVSVDDARPRRDQRPVHPVPRQRPRREPGMGRPARGRPDDLDGPRRRRRGDALGPRVPAAPVRRRHRRRRGLRRAAGRRARAVGAVPDHVRGRLRS